MHVERARWRWFFTSVAVLAVTSVVLAPRPPEPRSYDDSTITRCGVPRHGEIHVKLRVAPERFDGTIPSDWSRSASIPLEDIPIRTWTTLRGVRAPASLDSLGHETISPLFATALDPDRARWVRIEVGFGGRHVGRIVGRLRSNPEVERVVLPTGLPPGVEYHY